MSNELPAGFGTNDPDFIAHEYAESKKIRDDDGGKVVFFKSGVTHCRILPPHEDAPSWFRGYKEHGLRPNGKFQTFTCPLSIDADDACPICEEGKELYEALGEANIKRAKNLYAKSAFLYNAYVYSNPDSKGLKDGIVILKSGVKVYKQLMEFDNDPAGDWGDISNLQDGIDFRITRKGKGRFDTEYVVSPVPTRTNIIEKLEAEGFEIGAPNDLTAVYPPKSFEELQVALKDHEYEGD